MKNNAIWIVIAIAVLLGLGWWLYSMQAGPQAVVPEETGAVAGSEFADNSKDGAAGTDSSVSVTVGAPAATITYTDAGFSPATVTIKKGQAVTFVNKSSREMRVASDEHPSHTGYDGTNKDAHCAPGYAGAKPFDECEVGMSFTFTFTKTGSWGFHNHRNDDDHGTVIVTD